MTLYSAKINRYGLTLTIEHIDAYLGALTNPHIYFAHFVGDFGRLSYNVEQFLDALRVCVGLKATGIPVFIAALYTENNHGLPDMMTTFRILPVGLVEPHGIIGRHRDIPNVPALPRYSSLLLHSFLSTWSFQKYSVRYFFVKPIKSMVKILMEKLKLNDQWIPIAVGFSGDVENIGVNYESYRTHVTSTYKRKFRSRKNTKEYFMDNIAKTYIMTQLRNRGALFPSPIRVDWKTRVVEIDGVEIPYEEFQRQISTGDTFTTPYTLDYWGPHNPDYDAEEDDANEQWNSFGSPHIMIRISDLLHYWTVRQPSLRL